MLSYLVQLGAAEVATVVVDAMVDEGDSDVPAIQLVSSRLNSISKVTRCLVFIFYLWRNSAAIQ